MTSNTDNQYAEQLARDTRDAKRAPEIPAWLRLGPRHLQELVEFRRERLIDDGFPEERADSRAVESVLHDLGRVGGLGGPVLFDGSRFYLDESRRAVIDAWVREDAERSFAQMAFEV